MSTIKIVIVGAAGRMGRTLVRQVSQTPGCGVSGATEPAGSEFLGRDAGLLAGIDALGVAITDDPLQLIANANAVLDFTSPAAATSTCGLMRAGPHCACDRNHGLLRRNRRPPLPPPRVTRPSSRRAICRWGSICWRN